MKQTLIQIFGTKLGWLGISILALIVFCVLTNFYDWAYYGCYISLIYPVILGITMMVFAWIINPIRERKNKDGSTSAKSH